MKITQVGAANTTATRRTEKAGKSSGSAFASHLKKLTSDDDEDVGALDGASALASMGSILMVQSLSDEDGGARRRAHQRTVQRGEEILDGLEEVRRDLLTGAIPKDRLADLARMMRSRREQGVDPLLAAILDEIELRAEVELAKLTRA